MFVQLAQGGLGLFVEDNIFKLQCEYSVKGNLLNYTTEHLGFAPHSEYTLEWNLYPLQEGDYFDFINQVRDYLGVNNHTIPGAISWPINIKDNAVKKQYMANLGFKIPAIYWFDYDSFDPQDATTEQRLAPCFREYQKHKAFDPAMKPVFMWQNNYTRCNYKDMKEPFFPADPGRFAIKTGIQKQSRPIGAALLRELKSYFRLKKAFIPGYSAMSPSSSSMRRSWLYLATRSVRLGAPVLIWPALRATAMSAMVASSVSPER